MASQSALRASSQVPNRNLVPSLPVLLLHFLQRSYGSVCHHLFVPLVNDAARRKKAAQNALVVVGTCLLLLLISVSDNPVYTAVDYEILKRVQEVSNKELCLQSLRGFPFVVRSLDVEVGLVLNGTLLFRFSPTVQSFTDAVTFAEVARKRREKQRNNSRNEHEQDVLKSSPELSKPVKFSGGAYSHSESESVLLQPNTQSKNGYSGDKQPNQKQRSPKDDFITRPTRKRVFDDIVVTSHSWEPIAEDDGNLFVYSAFYDDRPSKHVNGTRRVRVLGMSVLHEILDFPHLRSQVFCHYRWKSTHRLHVSQRGKIMSIWEDHNKTYHAVFVICELHLCGSPDYVGITVERDVLPLSYLPVKYPMRTGGRFKHSITTCFPIMHSHYSNKLELLQVLEADRILGAEKFKLYLHSASPEVLAIIRHYVTSGVMEAVEWHLPFTDVSLVHYFGQMAAINDCLYSYQYTSRYVVFHDFDEVLFPRAHDTWNLMLEAVRRQENSWVEWWRQWRRGQYGSYTFMHVCFPKNWTHPGLRGNAVIEGSNVEVRPGDVQPFVFGHIAILPSAKDEMKSNKEKGEGGERELASEHVARQKGASETVGGRRTGGEAGGERGRVNDGARTAGQAVKGSIIKEWRGRKIRASLSVVPNEEARHRPSVRGRDVNDSEHSRSSASGEHQKEENEPHVRHSVTSRPPQRPASNRSRHRHKPLLHEVAERNRYAVRNARGQPKDPLLSNLDVDSNHRHQHDDKYLTTLHYTWRENFVWAPEWRSKMLVKPATVEMMGIHSVHMHVKGYQSKKLAAEMALVHHYRKWWVRNGTAMIHDTTAHRLATRLTANVRSVLSEVLGVQLDSDN